MTHCIAPGPGTISLLPIALTTLTVPWIGRTFGIDEDTRFVGTPFMTIVAVADVSPDALPVTVSVPGTSRAFARVMQAPIGLLWDCRRQGRLVR